MNILIVDDDHLLGSCLRDYLLNKGISATCLWDGKLAADWLDENPCDAIVMDMNMPELDGIAATWAIRETHPKIPILIWTGLGYEDQLIDRAREAGANGFLSKVMGAKAVFMNLLQLVDRRNLPCRLLAA